MHKCCSEASQRPELASLVNGKFENSPNYRFFLKWLHKGQPCEIISKNVDSGSFFWLTWNEYVVKQTR